MKLKQPGDTGVQVPELALGTRQYRGGDPYKLESHLALTSSIRRKRNGTEPVVGQAIRGIRDRVF
jgi:hypothetical protein